MLCYGGWFSRKSYKQYISNNIEPMMLGSEMQISVKLEILNKDFDNIVMSEKMTKQKVFYINLDLQMVLVNWK